MELGASGDQGASLPSCTKVGPCVHRKTQQHRGQTQPETHSHPPLSLGWQGLSSLSVPSPLPSSTAQATVWQIPPLIFPAQILENREEKEEEEDRRIDGNPPFPPFADET